MIMCETAQAIRVSVICIAYNHGRYIRDALEGFVAQRTTFPFEVVVHDDASTDDTAAIIREYEQKYPEIIRPVFERENQYSQGKNYFFSKVLPILRGEYVALCEGDDYWIDPLKLQKQYDYICAHPDCSLVAHNSEILYMSNGRRRLFSRENFDAPEKCELSAEQVIGNHMLFHTSSMFFRKSYYLANEQFLMAHRSFDYLTKSLLATEGKVHFIPEVMSVYRMGTVGSWTDRTAKDVEMFVLHERTAIKALEDLNAYRGYRYDAQIRDTILRREFQILLRTRDFAAMKREPYLQIYRRLSRKGRIKICLSRFFPRLIAAYDRYFR